MGKHFNLYRYHNYKDIFQEKIPFNFFRCDFEIEYESN